LTTCFAATINLIAASKPCATAVDVSAAGSMRTQLYQTRNCDSPPNATSSTWHGHSNRGGDLNGVLDFRELGWRVQLPNMGITSGRATWIY
jgi:hypothetical protein